MVQRVTRCEAFLVCFLDLVFGQINKNSYVVRTCFFVTFSTVFVDIQLKLFRIFLEMFYSVLVITEVCVTVFAVLLGVP